MSGHLVVVRELLVEAAAPLRDRTKVECKAEHLVLRDRGAHELVAVVGLSPEDLAAPAIHVGHDVAQVLLGHADVRFYDRLQQHRACVQGSLADGHGAGDLEGHVVRVDLVELAVHERHPDVDHRVPSHHALGHVVDDPLLDRGAEILRNRAAEDLVLPDKALASLGRSHLDDADPVLTVTTRLLDVPALGPAVARYRLAVRHARGLRGRLDAVLALELL